MYHYGNENSGLENVAAYAFDADIHCVDCTASAVHSGYFKIPDDSEIDANGIPLDAVGVEGNTIGAIFNGDECDYSPT